MPDQPLNSQATFGGLHCEGLQPMTLFSLRTLRLVRLAPPTPPVPRLWYSRLSSNYTTISLGVNLQPVGPSTSPYSLNGPPFPIPILWSFSFSLRSHHSPSPNFSTPETSPFGAHCLRSPHIWRLRSRESAPAFLICG